VKRPASDPQQGPESAIPDKLYFKIGEVADLVGVQAHVLRYWEREVPAIRPGKSASNQRRYRRRDVEIFREIRRLLYEERYTLAGAKRRIFGGGGDEPEEAPAPAEPVAAEGAPAPDPGQLPLGFSKPADAEKLERVKEGLRELIRLTGEEP
jgi:DNA-binding transcriptional MerR regulator